MSKPKLLTDQRCTFYNLSHFNADGGMDTYLEAGGYREVDDIRLADIVVFNGGTDIGTALYNEKPIHRSVPHQPSVRDQKEMAIFEKYAGEKFFLGICRGAQFLNVMNGGSLWQDVTNHGRSHPIMDLITGKTYTATSTHHQMMRPAESSSETIAVARESSMKHCETLGRHLCSGDEDDHEIVWYPKGYSLCIQGHPEYVPHSEFADYCLGLLSSKLKESRIVHHQTEVM